MTEGAMTDRPAVEVDRAELAALRIVFIMASDYIESIPDGQPMSKEFLALANAVNDIKREHEESEDPWASRDLVGLTDVFKPEIAGKEASIRHAVVRIKSALDERSRRATK